jgi:hypothetical protein
VRSSRDQKCTRASLLRSHPPPFSPFPLPCARRWEKPADFGGAGASGWTAVKDPTSGKTYYHNAGTGATSWEKPAGFVDPADVSPPPKEQREVMARAEPRRHTACGVDYIAISRKARSARRSARSGARAAPAFTRLAHCNPEPSRLPPAPRAAGFLRPSRASPHSRRTRHGHWAVAAELRRAGRGTGPALRAWSPEMPLTLPPPRSGREDPLPLPRARGFPALTTRPTPRLPFLFSLSRRHRRRSGRTRFWASAARSPRRRRPSPRRCVRLLLRRALRARAPTIQPSRARMGSTVLSSVQNRSGTAAGTV